MRNTLWSVRLLPSRWMQSMTCICNTSQCALYRKTFPLLITSTSIADNSTERSNTIDKHGDNTTHKLNINANTINVVNTRSDINTIPFHSSIAPQKIEKVDFTNINISVNTNKKANTNASKNTNTHSNTSTSSTSSQSASSKTSVSEAAPSMTNTNVKITLDDNELIDELRRVVNRPLFMGDLFRSLTPAAKKTFVKKKMTLEEFILRHSAYFTVYRTGSASIQFKRIRVMLMVAPPFLVPENAEIIPPIEDEISENEQMITNSHSNTNNSHNSGASNHIEVNSTNQKNTKLHVDTVSHGTSHAEVQPTISSEKFIPSSSSFPDSKALERRMNTKEQLTLKERMETVLQYIPNEFESFSKLNMPRAVKVKCMNYPLTTPLSFFKKYPQYFEVTDLDVTIGSFKVRRSLTLQKRIESYVKNH